MDENELRQVENALPYRRTTASIEKAEIGGEQMERDVPTERKMGKSSRANPNGTTNISDSIADINTEGIQEVKAFDSVVNITVKTKSGEMAWDEAITDFRHRLRDIRRHQERGTARKLDELGAELKEIATGLESHPAISADFWGLLAQVHYRRGMIEEMEEAAGKALLLNGNCEPALLILGESKTIQGERSGDKACLGAAAEHYRTLVKHGMSESVKKKAAFELCQILATIGEVDEARELQIWLLQQIPLSHPKRSIVESLFEKE